MVMLLQITGFFVLLQATKVSAQARRQPALAEEMYQELCTGRVPAMNRCKCDFLRSVEAPRMDVPSFRGAPMDCMNGEIATGDDDPYPCLNTRLMSRVSIDELITLHGDDKDEEVSDCWGWVGSAGQEIVIITTISATHFIDVSNVANPVHLGTLIARGKPTFWHDVKTLDSFAFIVSEAKDHGLQVFDMRQLLSITNPPVLLEESSHYGGFGNAHNIYINEETAVAYVVGSNECKGGLLMLDISNPLEPTFLACFDKDEYVHDVQCVLYKGNDVRYTGREICFCCNEDTITIVDVTDKSNLVQLSRVSYTNVQYTHQGWLSEDHNSFLFGDEADEIEGRPTSTYVLNTENLDNPTIVGVHEATRRVIDHNQYIRDGHSYQGNYEGGLHVVRINDDITSRVDMVEVAYLDTFPNGERNKFNGVWSVYPFLPSRNVAVCSTDRGLFMTAVNVNGPPPPPPDDDGDDDDDQNECVLSRTLFSGGSRQLNLEDLGECLDIFVK